MNKPEGYSDKIIDLVIAYYLGELDESNNFKTEEEWALFKDAKEAFAIKNKGYFTQSNDGPLLNNAMLPVLRGFYNNGGFKAIAAQKAKQEAAAENDRQAEREERELNIKNMKFAINSAPWTLGIAILGLIVAIIAAYFAYRGLPKN